MPVFVLLALCLGWTAFGWSFNAPQQARLIGIDPENASVILALNAGCIYLGSAFGAWIGGLTLTHAGLDALGIVGGVVAFAAIFCLIGAERLLGRARNTA